MKIKSTNFRSNNKKLKKMNKKNRKIKNKSIQKDQQDFIRVKVLNT